MRRNREVEDGMGFKGHAPPRRRGASKPALPKKKPAKAARKPKQSERTLHMHCQQWLEKSGWWAKLLIFHVPNERCGGIGAIMYFKRLGVRKGVADYLVFGMFKSAAIELKDADGVQSAEQAEFQRRWEAAGYAYFVVRTLEEFQGTVTGLGMFC